jgi:HlyD family secretion protein
VRQDQPVSFTVFAYPRREFQGRVAQVRLQPRVEAGVVMYNCIIHVDNADLALKPGMTATLSIEVARHDDALTVPNAALRYVPEWPQEKLDGIRRSLEPGQAILWRVEDGGLVPLPVETGIVGDKFTEVIAPGLVEDTAIAMPPGRRETERRRRFGLSLF